MQGKARIIMIIMFVVWIIWIWWYAIWFFLWWNEPQLQDLSSASILWNAENNSTGANVTNNNIDAVLSWNSNLPDLVSTWSTITTWDVSDLSNKVYLHIPAIFNSFNLNKFKAKYEAKNNVVLIIKSYDDLNEYYNLLSTYLSWNNSNIDIFMIPTTQINNYSSFAYKLKFSQSNVAWLFNRIFSDLIDNEDYTYIPYSVDPFVTIAKSWLYDENKPLTLSKIKETVLTSNQNGWFKIKFLFWVSLKDWFLLKTWKQPFEDYFLILYNLLFQSSLTSNDNILKTFLDFSDQQTFNVWSNSKFNNLVNINNNKNDKCNLYKKVCLMSNNNADAFFGFLSDLDAYQTYFPNWKVWIDDITIHNFIQEWQSYMVKWRWFFINKNSKQLKNSVLFINDYIQESVEGNTLLWWNTFSAFNSIFDKQKMNTKFANIINYTPNFYLIASSKDLQKTFMNWTKIFEVIKWTYNLELFLTNLSYSRWF